MRPEDGANDQSGLNREVQDHTGNDHPFWFDKMHRESRGILESVCQLLRRAKTKDRISYEAIGATSSTGGIGHPRASDITRSSSTSLIVDR